MQVKQLRDRLLMAQGKRQQLQANLSNETALSQQQATIAANCAGAQLILQESARLTQEHLQYRIGTLVTLAMEAVFDDPYRLEVLFENARGRTQASINFMRGDEILSPLDASGGGAVDVAAFGLQVSLWTLQNPKTRPVLFLDEPLKWLKGGSLPEKGAAMLQEISQKMGIQIIMVSHALELISHADKVFRVTKKNNISTVKEIL